MSRDCGYYETLISRMLDGDLTDAETRELREHLLVCADCRALCDVMTAAADALREDMAEPPEALVPGVMARISAAGSEARPKRRPARLWPGLAAAACLLLILGGGTMAVLRARTYDSASGAVMESVTMEAAAADMPAEAPAADMPAEAPAAAAPMPEPYDGGALYAAAVTEAEESEGTPVEADAADVADTADGTAASAARSRAAYTIDAPASVPEGREADFEALLRDARWGGNADGELVFLAAVEYRGVIYEFLTDGGGELLLWRDAAEGLVPTLSPGTPDDLFDIIG